MRYYRIKDVRSFLIYTLIHTSGSLGFPNGLTAVNVYKSRIWLLGDDTERDGNPHILTIQSAYFFSLYLRSEVPNFRRSLSSIGSPLPFFSSVVVPLLREPLYYWVATYSPPNVVRHSWLSYSTSNPSSQVTVLCVLDF